MELFMKFCVYTGETIIYYLGGITMKRFRFIFLGLAILLCVTVTACSGETVPDESASSIVDELIPDNISSVELSFAYDTELKTQTLTQTEIEELSAWVSQLSLTHRLFQEGETPSDTEGGTFYGFSFNDDEMYFAWVDIGSKHFIHYEGEWYEINNTSEPPLDLP